MPWQPAQSLLQTQLQANTTLPRGWIPQLVQRKIIIKTRENITKEKKGTKKQAKFKQYKASRAHIRRSGHSEARKNLTKIGAGNLGRNQSRLRLPGPPTGPVIMDLNVHRPSNLDKLFWYSFKITKLRLRILPTNMPVLH